MGAITMEFKNFRDQLAAHVAHLIDGQDQLFIADVSKSSLWETYLTSYPQEEQQGHTCNSCRSFMRAYGHIVAIVDGKVRSIWDFECEEPFQTVVNNLRDLVETAPIRDMFITDTTKLGMMSNPQHSDPSIVWQHLALVIPEKFVTTQSGVSFAATRAKKRDAIQVFKRTLKELTTEAFEIVLELNAQGSIPRGPESKDAVSKVLELKHIYDDLAEDLREGWIWKEGAKLPESVAKIRNTAIGTLLIDVSKGKELDRAMGAYEHVICGANYKRPKALATPGMIKKASEDVEELGLTTALGRRHAVSDDITVNNVLFVDRAPKVVQNVFEALTDTLPENPKKYAKIEEIHIDKFMKDILPTAKSLEVMMEGRHTGNLMTLIAPTNKDASPLFKWGNGFSWTYNNDMADSMKEAVKQAGGKVDGVLRFSIRWNENLQDENIDFDAHCHQPNGRLIYYLNSYDSTTKGKLDVDITNPGKKAAVENITWPELDKMAEGEYHFLVHNFSSRTSKGGFSAEIEYAGEVYSFEYNQPLRGHSKTTVAKVKFTKAGGIEFTESLPSDSVMGTKEVWKLNTNKFHKVKMFMHSPNFWDEKKIGNKHHFFILENCLNPEPPRGFYNEFLRDDLTIHRKTFEMLGAKMKVPYSDVQLSGMGFSCTQRNSVICRVEGSFKRIIKIIF